MMKWILAIVGYLVTHSFWGAVGGYLIGAALFPSSGGNGSSETSDGNTRSGRRTRDTYTYTYGTEDRQATARQAFLDSLLELSAHIIQADGRIMHSEMETTRRFFRTNFGEATMQACNQRLLTIFEERRALSASLRWQRAYQSCRNIALAMNQEVCIQLMAYLVEIAKADGNVGQEEISALRSIAIALGLDESIVAQMLSLGSDTLDDAYKALGISPDATDDEVRKAYRKLALQYHPDRVATLGDDIREAATRKFQEINDAKERIFKARGM